MYTLIKYYAQIIMEIAASIPLMLEINNSVDFLNLIPNVEEHNLEFVEELDIAM